MFKSIVIAALCMANVQGFSQEYSFDFLDDMSYSYGFSDDDQYYVFPPTDIIEFTHEPHMFYTISPTSSPLDYEPSSTPSSAPSSSPSFAPSSSPSSASSSVPTSSPGIQDIDLRDLEFGNEIESSSGRRVSPFWK